MGPPIPNGIAIESVLAFAKLRELSFADASILDRMIVAAEEEFSIYSADERTKQQKKQDQERRTKEAQAKLRGGRR